MDANEYTLECMVRAKLQQAHEASRRRALLGASRRPGWRERLGATLITAGVWLSSSAAAAAPAGPVDALLGQRSHG